VYHFVFDGLVAGRNESRGKLKLAGKFEDGRCSLTTATLFRTKPRSGLFYHMSFNRIFLKFCQGTFANNEGENTWHLKKNQTDTNFVA